MLRTASEFDDIQARPEKLAKQKSTAGEALLTCVLVLYPALATVATIAGVLSLSGMSA